MVSYGAAVHDYFDVLGVPADAPRQEIRRACARRVRRWHPDFDGPGVTAPAPASARLPGTGDAAIESVDMAAVIERMQTAFFGRRS